MQLSLKLVRTGFVTERLLCNFRGILKFLTARKKSCRAQTGTLCLPPVSCWQPRTGITLLVQTRIPAVPKLLYSTCHYYTRPVADRWARWSQKSKTIPASRLIKSGQKDGEKTVSLSKRKKNTVNNYPMFPIARAADPWRLRSDWCLIVLCWGSLSPFSVARKRRETGQLFLIYLVGQILAYWAELHSLVEVCVLIIDTLRDVGFLRAFPRRPVCS